MSNTKKYPSIYGATRPIRPDQYLVELIIKRRADKQGVALPDRFWAKKEHGDTFDYWNKIFGSELRHAKALFAKYDAECVIDAFQSFDCQYVLSATNKKLEDIAKEFQRRKAILDEVEEKTALITTSVNTLPRKPTGTKSKLSRLK